MNAGFGILGVGLFLLSLAGLSARVGQPLAWGLLVLSLVALGFTFSPGRARGWIALGLAAGTGVVALLGLGMGLPVWSWGLTLLFTIGFALLWAEQRFPDVFGRGAHRERVPAHRRPVERDPRGIVRRQDEEPRHRM